MNAYIILNPTAAKGAAGKARPEIEAALVRHGIEASIVLTERPGHAIELARQAARDGRPLVVAAGGDGTTNEVVNGLMLARADAPSSAAIRPNGTALGVLPVGRGNDFAYGAGIPDTLEPACDALAAGHRATLDVGYVSGGRYPEGRYFANGVGIGFDAVVGFEAAKMPRIDGFLNYFVAALKTIVLYYRAPTVILEIEDPTDGHTVTHRLPALLVSVMNGRRMGGGFLMAPDGSPADGFLDLCIARQVSRGRVFTLIPHFMRGTQATQPPIMMARTGHVIVTALDGALPAHADGETLCTEGDRLELSLVPAQIEVITAREPTAATKDEPT